MTAIKLAAALLLALPLAMLAVSCSSNDDTASSTPVSSETAIATPDISALPIPDPHELHVAAAAGTGDKVIFASDQPISDAISPDGSQIAVSEGLYYVTTMHFLNFDGTERARATYNSGSGGQLEWSPDGRYLVSTFNTAGSQDLVAFSSDGSSQKQLLTSSPTSNVLLSGWLPDGELLVEKPNSTNTGANLLAFDLSAGTSRAFTDMTVLMDYFGRPAIAPDGKTLAVLAPGGTAACSTTIWTLDLASGATTQVTPDGFCGGGGIVWSPDGTQLAYSALTTADASTLNIVSLATGQSRTIAHGLDNVIAWLPDGTLLANEYSCIGCDGGVLHLFAIDSGGGGARHDLTASPSSAVSPSGRIVTADGAVKTLDASGRQLSVLAPQESGWGYFSFAWTRDESHITYLRLHTSGTRVFEVNRDGSGFQQTVYSTASNPQLSPDGKRFAYFVSTNMTDGKDKAGSALWLANPDGSNAIQVDVSGSPATIAWAPDSTRLLFLDVAGPGEPGSPYVVNSDGSGVRQMTTQTLPIGDKGAGIWAPNGKLVVFADAPMTVLNVDSGDSTSVSPGTQKGIPTWSADSSKLIYPVYSSSNGMDIYITSVDGSATTQIAGNGSSCGGLAVSPDGSKIACIASKGNTGGLAVMDIEGGGKTTVLSNAVLGAEPVWSPDSQWLAATVVNDDGSGVYVVRADGSGAQQLTRSGAVAGIWWIGNDRLRIETFLGGL